MGRVLVTFDVDGTLMHSVGPLANRLHKRAFAHALERVFGIADGTIDVVKHHGSTDPLILVNTLEHYGIAREEASSRLPELKQSMVDYAKANCATVGDGLQLLPGVEELLAALSAKEDVLVGLVTGNLEDIAWMKMNGLNILQYFSRPNFGGFGSDNIDRGQLVKLALQRAQQLFDCDIRLHLHVGDTPNDIAAADFAGALPVGVCTGVFPREELLQSSTTGKAVILPDLTNIQGFLALCE